MTGGERDGLELSADQLRRRVDPATLPFATTEEVAPLRGTIGQPRAVDAIEFGLDIEIDGYNLYVAGAPGSGRESTTRDFLARFAPDQPTPPDWVYVHNFDSPDRPRAISLPAGLGVRFARDMEEFVQAALRDIPRAFESEEYDERQRNALAEIQRRRDQLTSSLNEFARQRGFLLQMTPAGIATVPVADGQPIQPDQFQRLPEEQRARFEEQNQEVQQRIASTMREVRQLEKEATERMRALEREVALFAVGPLFDELRERYDGQPEILEHLAAVQNDLPENLSDFRPDPQQPAGPVPGMAPRVPPEERLARYYVNVLIDNSSTTGAPVCEERNPTYYNLIGRIDYRSAFGAMVTDFRQIRPGILHRANGGFLMLHATDLLASPFAWDALKRSLICQEIQIENLGEQMSPLPTARLRPEPIPLSVKVVLIGPPMLYHMLYNMDEDFGELFRVRADFAPDMDWHEDHVANYAAFVSRQIHRFNLRHFDASAVARVVEHGGRLREHQRKLSTRLLDISNVVAEASYWAEKDGSDLVSARHVEQAIAKKEYRSNLIEERLLEVIADGTVMIDTEGVRTGQVNGLAVLGIGDFRVGKPARITARVSLGQRGVQSIERETRLSRPIHSKGVLTLAGYLAGKYGQEHPLALHATIAFEQSYDEIDGDSASSTELYALLSALSELPLRQGIAVTGSVNQYGEIQAVGGVTAKIEGFFDVCQFQGLTGDQGVLIPASNVQNLMLKDEVVEAVATGRFHVWAIETVDQGISLLTGVPAGEADDDGRYPEGTVHRLVQDRLRHFARLLRSFGARPEPEQRESPDQEPEEPGEPIEFR
jgi:lon-related putative ATP-dependent protease